MNKELKAQILSQVRNLIAIFVTDQGESFSSKPLDVQKAILKERALGIVAGSGYSIDANDEDLKDLIQDFLVAKKTEKAKIVYIPTWKPWLKEEKPLIKWAYSRRYFNYLLGPKKWAKGSVDSIDETSDQILDHCGDPKADYDFFVKGLVVGDIQSGKTANYTALINKAVDAGYKIIIVLAGTTKDLRQQTQKRIDTEVLGYSTFQNDTRERIVGVGLMKPDIEEHAAMITNSSPNGDIKKNNGSYPINASSPCFLAVIKKNPSTLQKVIDFITDTKAAYLDPDKKLPFPVLVIDDEADLASIDTSNQEGLESATGTNRLIRTILCHDCRRVTYVGYTATPFANVFIKPYEEVDKNDADDIFPSDFIVTLPEPPGYSGVKAYFGITSNTESNDAGIRTDLLAPISEKDRASFKKFGQDNVPTKLQTCLYVPDSLRDAIKCFLIGAGIKVSRGIVENCTMLVNVDVRQIYNETLRDNVRSIFNDICNRFLNVPKTRDEFRAYWEEHMAPVSQARLAEEGRPFSDTWEKISEGIDTAISWKNADTVKLITGSSNADTLDYTQSDYGLYVVVGGQKLSRGLTLEGLSVSYYGRKASAFDTLLQMGRWFGYRKGWIDVCRVFTTQDIANNFIEAAIAMEGFKNQVAIMNENHSTPLTFGLRVRTFSAMLPTSRNKMRNAEFENVTFSGSISQLLSYSFFKNVDNLKATESFLKSLGSRDQKRLANNNIVFTGITPKQILAFLTAYRNNSNAIPLWREYIKAANERGELIHWTVSVSALRESDSEPAELAGYTIYKAQRTVRRNGENMDGFDLRVLGRPSDYLDLFDDTDPRKKQLKDHFDPEDTATNAAFTPDMALLAIYLFDPHSRIEGADGKAIRGATIEKGKTTVGLAVWFPTSKEDVGTKKAYLNPVAQVELNRQSDASKASDVEERTKK